MHIDQCICEKRRGMQCNYLIYALYRVLKKVQICHRLRVSTSSSAAHFGLDAPEMYKIIFLTWLSSSQTN